MYYGEIKCSDIANGIGVRISLFVSGCTRQCEGCFNKETWDFKYGKPFKEEVEDFIIKKLAPSHIKGLTVLGGEPMEYANQKDLLPFLQKVKETYPNKSIWCFTGYELDTDILGRMVDECEYTRPLLECIDVLVDGRFIEELKDITLRFRGSSNQRIIDVKETLAAGEIVLWNPVD